MSSGGGDSSGNNRADKSRCETMLHETLVLVL